MRNLIGCFSVILLFGVSHSKANDKTNVTINDLYKTVELCQSMRDFKGWCPDAAKACAHERTYLDKKNCLLKHGK